MLADPTKKNSGQSRARIVILVALDDEVAREPDVRAAVSTLCDRLGAYLTHWIGAAGLTVVLERAVAESTQNAPGAVTLGAAGELYWSHEPSSTQLRETCVRLVSTMVAVLGRFVGSEMALRLTLNGLEPSSDENARADIT